MNIPGRYLLLIVTVFCVGLILVTYNTNILMGPMNSAANYMIVPFQNGISKIGGWIIEREELVNDIHDLQKENEELKDRVAQLETENTNLQTDRHELDELRTLYALDHDYRSYDKTGASIIAKDAGNWYHSFIIDKGTNDGLLVDMNVIAGAGLVGRITSIGPSWSRVEAIVDDNANVAAMVLKTQDNMIVSGSLENYTDGTITFSRLQDPDNEVNVGDRVVTSNISDKYIPGILVGYISESRNDANNLTKSGSITPAVDFAHLNTVLVITELKESVDSE